MHSCSSGVRAERRSVLGKERGRGETGKEGETNGREREREDGEGKGRG